MTAHWRCDQYSLSVSQVSDKNVINQREGDRNLFTLNACLAAGEEDGVEAAIIVAAQSKALLDVKHIIG
ncbi:MAG: hypothetical protein NZQ09_02320 [Chloroflexus sp.]|nr:hypothetical protein [Chloroflexus sp.]